MDKVDTSAEAIRTYTWNGNTLPISKPHLSDAELAGEIRMLMRDQLDHEAICCAARDRIMCIAAERDTLRAQLADAKAENERLIKAVFADRNMNQSKDQVDMAIHLIEQIRAADGQWKTLHDEVKAENERLRDTTDRTPYDKISLQVLEMVPDSSGDVRSYVRQIATTSGIPKGVATAILRQLRNDGLAIFGPCANSDTGEPCGGGYNRTLAGDAVIDAWQAERETSEGSDA